MKELSHSKKDGLIQSCIKYCMGEGDLGFVWTINDNRSKP